MFQLFYEGGWEVMTLLTLDLVALIWAIWKAPHQINNLGRLAWAFALSYCSFEMILAFDEIQAVGGISEEGIPQAVLFGGLKVVLIPILYAALIYTVSVIANIIVTRKRA